MTFSLSGKKEKSIRRRATVICGSGCWTPIQGEADRLAGQKLADNPWLRVRCTI
jgi:hypothetical protein